MWGWHKLQGSDKKKMWQVSWAARVQGGGGGQILETNYYTSVPCEPRADRSFISLESRPLIDLNSNKLEEVYTIEIANNHKFEAKEVLLDGDLNLAHKIFKIDLIPIEQKNVDVVVGIYWLFKVRAEIGCFEKVVQIPLQNGESLVVQGDRPGKELKIVSAIKMKKYLGEGVFRVCGARVHLLGRVVNEKGIHVAIIEVVKKWVALRNPIEIHKLLGLVGCYKKFIENFLKIAKPLMKLTQKAKEFTWGE
ncbi:hypothetical protein Tco_1563114 [Tanacetum coccineum]